MTIRAAQPGGLEGRRVYFASDLHIDVRRGRAAAEELADWLSERARPDDILLLGGDYGNDEETRRGCLELFADFPGVRLGIAGNHDVWGEPGDSAWPRYRRLADLLEAHGIHPLEREPYVDGQVGFVGAMGWYDYSFRVPELDVPMEVYRRKGMPGVEGPVWNDGQYVDWRMSDPEVTDRQLEQLAGQLEQLSGVGTIVPALHHVPTEGLLRPAMLPDFVPRRLIVPRKWLILNTYLGSRRFGELFAEYAERIEVAFCGHIHLRRGVVEDGITYVRSGSDHTTKEVIVWESPRLWRKTFRG